jgi:hypothetical protein
MWTQLMGTDAQVNTEVTDEALDDDFQAGFTNAETSTETPRTDDKTGEEANPAEQTAPPPEFVQLTKQEVEELKARAALIDEIKATQDKSFGTLGGTIRSIRQDLDAMRQGKKVEIDQADIDALKEDFPGLSKALEKVRDLQVIAPTVDQEAIGKMVDERAGAKVTALLQDLESRALRRVHPDWKEYGESKEFAAWVGAQPAEFQQKLAAASDAWDSDFIGSAMTSSKTAAKAKASADAKAAEVASNAQDDASARRSRMSAAVSPRGSGATPGPNDDDQFHEGFKTG